MECKICEQPKTKLYCQKCVKDGVRLQNHQLLAVARKKDEAFDKVKEFLNTDVSRRVRQAHAERDEKKHVIKAARQEIERIQGVIRKERQRLENVKGDVATRKSNLASGMKGIRGSFNANTTSLKAETGRVKDKRETVHQNIAIARRSRVREAAELLGLRKLLGKQDSYVIAGILIVDLHLIRNYAPIYLVLGISHVTHLLTLISDYLYLKLPHEIIPPSRGNAYTSIRKSPTTKPIPITIPTDPSTENPSKAWQGRKLKDMPNVDSLIEAFALVAWDIAWVLWTQQLWPPPPGKLPGNEPLEACRLARNLVAIVSSPRIGRISHGSTMEFVPVMENLGKLPTFGLTVRGIQEVITGALEDGCAGGAGDGEGGGWDMVEGGEEVMRADGWLKLNPVSSTDG